MGYVSEDTAQHGARYAVHGHRLHTAVVHGARNLMHVVCSELYRSGRGCCQCSLCRSSELREICAKHALADLECQLGILEARHLL